jgi:hypothetical protein
MVWPLCTEPKDHVHIDLFCPLNTTKSKKHGNVYDWCIYKVIKVIAIEKKQAETLAEALFNQWTCKHDTSVMFLMNQGKEFCNEIMYCLCKLMDIQKFRTTPYHPQCNSQVEVMNRVHWWLSVLDTVHWEAFIQAITLAYSTYNLIYFKNTYTLFNYS